MAKYTRYPELLSPNGWCPGCGYGIFTRLLYEVIEEKGLSQKHVYVGGVGCNSNLYGALEGGNKIECHHGRAPVCANGVKAMLPDTFVFTIQGDGDSYAIGMGETIIAAHNNFPITVFAINNANYGMTGGQTAPTTLPGQITTTSPHGREGKPFDIIPQLRALDVAYCARGTTASLSEIIKLKKYIAKAIDLQMKERQYAFVETLSPCPTNWHKGVMESNEWILNNTVKYLPLGEYERKED